MKRTFLLFFAVTACDARSLPAPTTGEDGAIHLAASAGCADTRCPVPKVLAPGSGYTVYVLDENFADLTIQSDDPSVLNVQPDYGFHGCCLHEDALGRCDKFPGYDPTTGLPQVCDGPTVHIYQFGVLARSAGTTTVRFANGGQRVDEVALTVAEPSDFALTAGAADASPYALDAVDHVALTVGGTRLVALRFYTADGKVVFGETGSVFSVADPNVAELVHDGPPDPSRWWAPVGQLAARAAGATSLIVDAVGHSREFPVTVSAR
jgi:hypothetical protein